MRYKHAILFLGLLLLCGCNPNTSQRDNDATVVLKAPPEDPDSSKYYIFYLHGRIVEGSNGKPVSSEYGTYEYYKIVQEFAQKGFVTISEIREKDADIKLYSKKVVKWIQYLLNNNVPAKQITVVGASKGGMIAAEVSSNLKNRDLKFVILAGLYESHFKDGNIELHGDILSIYDKSDKFKSSPELFFTSKGVEKSESIVTQTGLGHGLLYTPLKIWVDEVIKWSGK